MDTISNEKKPKAKSKTTTSALRVKHETRKRILAELVKLNKKDFGRRVRPDDLISFAISLIEPKHIQALQEKSFSNADRLDRDYRSYIQKNGTISRDEFLGKILSGEINKSSMEIDGFPEGKLVK